MERDLLHATAPEGWLHRETRNRLRFEFGLRARGASNNPQTYTAFGDERITVWQESEAEGAHQSPRYDDDANFVLFR
jgi:hypothetical protein